MHRHFLATSRTIGLIAALAVAALPASAHAATGSQGLEISPPLVELTADKGQSLTIPIKLRNISSGQLVVTGVSNNFVADGEQGAPLVSDEKLPLAASFKDWVAPIQRLQLRPGEVQTVQVNVAVPANAEPGGHYGIISFVAVPPELEGTGVSLSAALGTLVLTKVNGPIQEEISSDEFFTATQSGARKTLFERSPVLFVQRLSNKGNIHVKPTGTIDVTDIFGNKVASASINDPARNVIPRSARKFEREIKDGLVFGRYTATSNLRYGDGKTVIASTTFWVIPYTAIGIGLLILLTLVGILRFLIKRYNSWVIAQARAAQGHARKAARKIRPNSK